MRPPRVIRSGRLKASVEALRLHLGCGFRDLGV